MNGSIEDAQGILKGARNALLHRSNVVATGIGYKNNDASTPSIICSVSKKLPLAELSPKDFIPKSLDGIPTDVLSSGIFRAFATQTERMRPAPGGISIGHTEITAGTLGCLVKRGGNTYILSNNHVIANSNDAQIGDAIIQPGPIDGGLSPPDIIAELAEFIPMHYLGHHNPDDSTDNDSPSTCPLATGLASSLNGLAKLAGSQTRMQAVTKRSADNFVDAAIAGPVDTNLVASNILNVGEIAGIREAELGMAVQKSGRTTGYTTGTIQQIDVTVNVQYGGGRIAQFTDQLIAGDMSQGGDSGSAVLDMDNHIVGLLFAGSDTVTIMNRIQRVFTSLNVSL